MKRFEIHSKEDGRILLATRPTGWGEVRGLLIELRSFGEQDKAHYYVGGNQVDWQSMLDAANSQGENERAKKLETHREISWLAGSCKNTRRYAWVRK
jgi:hypothetical protein